MYEIDVMAKLTFTVEAEDAEEAAGIAADELEHVLDQGAGEAECTVIDIGDPREASNT